MIDASDEPLRPFYRVTKILLRTLHLSSVETVGVEKIETHFLNDARPIVCRPRPVLFVISQHLIPDTISPIVERYKAVRNINMVSGESPTRQYSLGEKARHWWIGQIHARENMACTMAEEYPVRQLPPADRVGFNFWVQEKHR